MNAWVPSQSNRDVRRWAKNYFYIKRHWSYGKWMGIRTTTRLVLVLREPTTTNTMLISLFLQMYGLCVFLYVERQRVNGDVSFTPCNREDISSSRTSVCLSVKYDKKLFLSFFLFLFHSFCVSCPWRDMKITSRIPHLACQVLAPDRRFRRLLPRLKYWSLVLPIRLPEDNPGEESPRSCERLSSSVWLLRGLTFAWRLKLGH